MKLKPLAVGRLYIKIFLGFWLVMIAMLLGSSIITHFFDLGPDKHLSSQEQELYTGPGGRLLREVVRNVINSSYDRVQEGVAEMPAWAMNHVYLINDNGDDILERGIPADVQEFGAKLTGTAPFFRKKLGETQFYGRQVGLIDGHQLRLIVTADPSPMLGWRLFLHNFWSVLLLDILISGAACYYMARFITRDLQTFKQATQKIAKGDWNVRIGEEFCNRPGEMAELAQAFDNMVVKLQKSMLEQKRLIKDVSHELRSPLARLQVALAIAQQRANSEITGELERIKDAADYLNGVISEILSLPVTEQGAWELNDVVELTSLVTTAVDNCRDEARQNGIALKVGNHLPEVLVQTRGSTLVGVFDNIVRNAIRYTAPNTSVTINLQRAQDHKARITVSDCGPGVAEEHLDDIFEPFFRTDEARDRKSGGYGLGLAIAKRTVLHHGGSVVARNNPVRGLTIEINLPETADF